VIKSILFGIMFTAFLMLGACTGLIETQPDAANEDGASVQDGDEPGDANSDGDQGPDEPDTIADGDGDDFDGMHADGADTTDTDDGGDDAISPDEGPAPTLTLTHNGDELEVISTKPPTWRVVFAVGGGSPGGGTATTLNVPHDSGSLVQSRPNQTCCSAYGLDNLEWRWREFGGTQGTRSAVGLSSNVTQFSIVEQTDRHAVFSIEGNWPGVSQFSRETTITLDGYTTRVQATYSGTTGKDSMWWIISLFYPDKIVASQATVSDDTTNPQELRFTNGCTGLPAGIQLPCHFHFPVTTLDGHQIRMTVSELADNQGGNPNNYEFWDQGDPVGNYHMFYPRWVGIFEHATYNFSWSWRFTD